jgi:hypothetical protein
MRVTMGVDVDAGTRAERITVDAQSDLRDREPHGSKPLRPGACAGGAVEVVERACNREGRPRIKMVPRHPAIARPVKVFPYLSIH